MLRLVFVFVITVASFFVYAQEKLISYELIDSYSFDKIERHWKEKGVPKVLAPINYEVDIYKVLYYTEWHDGSRIKASGYYYAPKSNGDALALMVYDHGTRIIRKKEFKIGGEETICMLFATDGYAVLQPDYIGLGEGDKFHLYHHVQTEAMASIDMIRAIKELNAELGIELDGQLFLTGYSQGGHAAMATHKVMQEQFPDEFTVTASSPMSGAYDLAGAQSQAMFHDYSHPGYLPYLLKGMNEVYHIYDDFSYVLKEPYDSTLPPLYNGENSMNTINKVMPTVPKDIIKDSIIREFTDNPRYKFTQALVENSTYDWKPESPMMICYCNRDEQVFYKNAIVAYDKMKDNGAENVRLKRVGRKFGHNTCAVYATAYTKFYFDSFRKGSKTGRKGPAFKRMLLSIAKIKGRRAERKKQREDQKEE